MSVVAILGGIAVEVAKEAYDWANGELKSRAKEKLGEAIEQLDPKLLEQLIAAQFALLQIAAQRIVDEFAAAEARGKAHPLGGDAVEITECCACVVPDIVLDGDGTSHCANCGKPPFTRSEAR